jgi:hypothetical protein
MQTFDEFLVVARQQPEPQRLLLVFALADLAGDASPAQRAAHANGEAGALTPAVCVDRTPEEIGTFDALLLESAQAIDHWDILFVAAMDGRVGHVPNSDEAVQPMRMMVEQIRDGRVSRLLAINRQGDLVSLRHA